MSSDQRLLEGLELISRGIAMVNSEVPSQLQENRGHYTFLQSLLDLTLRRLDALEKWKKNHAEELRALQRNFNRILTEFVPKVDNLLVQLNGDPYTSEKCREDIKSVQIGRACVVNNQNSKLKNTTVQEEIVSTTFNSQMISVKKRKRSQKKKNGTLFNLAYGGVHMEISNAIASGAEINSVTNTGKSALMLAAINGHIDCVVQLLKCGANIFQKDDKGRTAKSYALSQKRHMLVDILSLIEKKLGEGYPLITVLEDVSY